MPEYKRKKSHTGRPKRQNPEVVVSEDIKVKRPKKTKNNIAEEENIRVVRGKKGEKRKKLLIFAAVIVAVSLLLAVLSAVLPVGLFESAQDFFLSLGSGNFPAEISGTTVVNCVPKGNYYYVLTDTSIMAFSNGGKKIFSYIHGFSTPVIVTSETRALVFDQGKNSAVIYNLAGIVDNIETKGAILTADIAKDGEYAFATKSESYASSVLVYNRKGKSLYSVNFAKDLVNHIDIASSGKKIAVSTVNSEGGKMVSCVRVYNFNKADPDYKLDLGQDIAYDIENTGKGFFVATHDKIRFINWSKYTVSDYGFEGGLSAVRYSNSGVLALYNKTNDKSDNNVILFSNSGKKITEFEIKGVVNDIRFAKGCVYSLGDSKIEIFDKKGKNLRNGTCGFGGIRLVAAGSNTVCIITDSEIQKTEIKKGDKA